MSGDSDVGIDRAPTPRPFAREPVVPEPVTGEPAAPRWSRRVGAVGAVIVVAVLSAGLLIGADPFGTGTPDAGSVDVGFAQDMSVHHRQAVQMASWERDRTADPALRQLAYDIESTQNQQIGRMQGWLGLWNQPALPVGGYMMWMFDDGAAGTSPGMPGMAAMPGMASSDELRRMRATPEPALDVVFLQLMLRHHQGGAAMLAYARDNGQSAEVRNLAGQMLTTQTAEADLMRQLLAQRGAQPLPL